MKKQAYPNLRGEMARRGFCVSSLARKMGVSGNSLGLKLNGKRTITLDFAIKIKNALETDVPLEVLFATEV